jgi:phosphoribosylamine---glycine ligase
MPKKSVLINGSGGREHAIAWAISQSPRVGKIYVAPGNGGTALMKNVTNMPIEATDVQQLAEFAESKKIDLTVIGPEKTLELGTVDEFRNRGLRVFGPTRGAAKIEWSKIESKTLMRRHKIPTAPFKIFGDYDEALKYVHGGECVMPKFIKADGLAQGKGAFPCHSIPQAERILRELMVKKIHGDKAVVIEDFLKGPEASFHALCDVKTFVIFPPSQDYKLSHTGDEGENTGGMGAFTPAPLYEDAGLPWVKSGIIQPALHALYADGNPFTGCLYPGVKITPEGTRVLEYNARFGDPECQVYVRHSDFDWYKVLSACVDGTLNGRKLKWKNGFAVCVVIASGGYPGAFNVGFPIYGIERAEKVPGVVVFHAGTIIDKDGFLITDGSRVLNVTAVGDTLEEARERAYEGVGCIAFRDMHNRKDIALTINSS